MKGCEETPILGKVGIKQSKSVFNHLMSYHVPRRKASFNFHKSISQFFDPEENEVMATPQEQVLKAKSDLLLPKVSDPADEEIMNYLKQFKEYIITIREH